MDNSAKADKVNKIVKTHIGDLTVQILEQQVEIEDLKRQLEEIAKSKEV